MAQNTGIAWCSHTFNPWLGCTRVSEGCVHCYAETMAARFNMVDWGPRAERKRTSESNWRAVKRWKPGRVFCASMADVFDDHPSIQPEWRADLWQLISETPQHEWLLLTKRPESIDVPSLPNVRIGVTTENQERADERIPVLLSKWSGPNFVSYEPAIGPVDFSRWRMDWIIAGGESGRGRRPPELQWFRDARDCCERLGTAFFFKQWGGITPKAGGKVLDGREWCEFPVAV